MWKNKKYTDYNQPTSSKKIFAFFIDALIVGVLSFITLNFFTAPTVANGNYFKANLDSLNVTIEQLYDIQIAAKLSVDSGEDGIVNDNELFKEYANMHIVLSYTYHQDEFNAQGINITDVTNKATYENDHLGYYYVHYKFENNIATDDYGSDSVKDYFVNKIILSDGGDQYYEQHGEDIPSFKAETAIKIYQYLNDENGDSNYYQNVSNFFLTKSHNAIYDLQNYDTYSVLFKNYSTIYTNLMHVMNLAVLLNFVAIYLLVIIIPSIIFANGFTLGRLAMKIRLDYSKMPVLSHIASDLMYFILFIFYMVLGEIMSLGMAFAASIILPGISMLLLLLVSLIVAFFDFAVMSFSSKKKTFLELVSGSRFVDIKVQKNNSTVISEEENINKIMEDNKE